MRRRDLLAGAAALPVAGLALPAASADDPALEAARRWIAAVATEEAYAYQIPASADWDDDPHAVALTDEERECWQAMLDTPPMTAAGLALMLACFVYRSEGMARGSHFSDPESWYFDGTEGQGTLYALLPVLWNSPAATELFPRITPPVDPGRPVETPSLLPYGPTVAEVRGAMVAAEAAGKPISEDEAIALLMEHHAAERLA